MPAFRLTAKGIELIVRLTPRAAHDRIDGFETGSDGQSHLAARVRAVPERGKANAALIALLADRLDLRKGDIAVISGPTSRIKRLEIAGNPDDIAAKLQVLAVPS
ncbi:hypothetical protein B7H23_05445 [Notoacmeibacter marinus]|uniref:UPF0235 protein B7H23_05445 n=1 Tax=Notoacmeibacter marinus TaxID=1876515 RepID=A0A231V489_9HYPH|nr:DUF167 family protein [Notoacmeibacter marinus]OXT02947.1 hypothetical protein B7H23_05445 [Notoacmeibacter marinus]